MVCFTNTPYSEALRCVYEQSRLLEKIMKRGDFFRNIKNNNFMLKLEEWIDEYAGTRIAQTFSIVNVGEPDSHSALRATG